MKARQRGLRFRAATADRQGGVLILLVILLPVFIILVGFAIDLAYIQLSRTEMRLAVDAAARAGADELSRTDSVAQARARAIEVAELNTVAGEPLSLGAEDVVFGHSAALPNGRWEFLPGDSPTNSLQIVGRRNDGSIDGPLPLFFGQFIDRSGVQTQLSAIAAFRDVDIVLVLDRSSSMKLGVNSYQQAMSVYDPRFCSPPQSGSRWLALDAAVQVFIAELDRTPAAEQVALVTFGGDISGYCGSWPPATADQNLTDSLPTIAAEMDVLNTSVWNGMTDIGAGIALGRETVIRGPGSRRLSEKIMLVLTDGYATTNTTLAEAHAAADDEVQISTITFGEADESLMSQVADLGGGIHYHADTAEELAEAFRKLAAQTAIIIQ